MRECAIMALWQAWRFRKYPRVITITGKVDGDSILFEDIGDAAHYTMRVENLRFVGNASEINGG